ncbi:MAG: UDP-N-acetylglucosamine 2-epimerase (non-hydrolyzing) [Gracilibacteraceae bacterium]|jgi:UDP-N-acetylglucosamine 2-epimerase (non-hydrolysing)|nr:UDP-N-acetylglucosamine 2-epimerase (non-hydrolyzing) [Gracilibacteraceae bacterium]
MKTFPGAENPLHNSAAPHVLAVFGTRPEAVKLAPVVAALRAVPLVTDVAVTAQHREMLDQVLRVFGLAPRYDLDLMRSRQELPDLTARILRGLQPVLRSARPGIVLVQGDTTTAFAAALAAFYHKIPIAHVEAGLRTGEKYSPWPEEANRRLVTVLADWHFAPTEQAAANLRREGVPPERVHVTGNTVIDALLAVVQPGYIFQAAGLEEWLAAQTGRRLLLATLHRRENWETMGGVCRALRTALAEFPDTALILPMHKNPVVRAALAETLGPAAEGPEERLLLCEPLDYADFANLMARVYLIVTDSGGVQEEAPSLGKPLIVARETTERPEIVARGGAVLAGATEEGVWPAIRRLLTDEALYARMSAAGNPYGDGQAAGRIAAVLGRELLKPG